MRLLQQTLLIVFHQLNNQDLDLENITTASRPTCQVGFEFGIAEESVFNFLDEEELRRLRNSVTEKALPTLDLFCAIRYHTTDEAGKRRPLKFDYHLLRFTFYKKNIELLISHERGTQRVPIEDLVTFLTNRINRELATEQQRPLSLKHLGKP